MFYLGDVHGKYARMKTLLRNVKDVIQVGDMGVGFRKSDGTFYHNPPHAFMKKRNIRFIRGNHDNPAVCRRQSQWIPDGYYEDGRMFVGGAFSVDRHHRTENFDWWADEELSQSQFYSVMDVYEEKKPVVMVTHDCPLRVAPFIKNSNHYNDSSITQQALQAMWELHQPKLHIFGHHHVSFDMVMNGTRFVCLAELELRWLEP